VGQEYDHLTLLEIFNEQKFLAANYQELDALMKQQVHLCMEHDQEWKHQQTQDNRWRASVDDKLQTIFDFLGQSVLTVPQPVSPSFTQPILPFGQHIPSSIGQPVLSSFGHPVPSSFTGSQPVLQTFGQPVPQTFSQPVPLSFNQPAPQTFANDNLGSHFGQYQITTQLRLLLRKANDLQALMEEGFLQEGLPDWIFFSSSIHN
jgi:hypothetical protein